MFTAFCLSKLHFQELQYFVDQYRRPEEGFEEADHTFLEISRMLEVIDKRADKSKTVNTAGNASAVTHLFYFFLLFICAARIY
ncbi:MAG: hypothetical protein XD84_0608 [Desulfotomaculum sp. 46_80]|nr:MAG: hypothetical protein XD84_0608 [Desulfotomaculum sp. 46_80]